MAETSTAQTPEKPEEKIPEAASKHYTWTGKDGKTIDYTGTAEMLTIYSDKGEAMCHQFCLSYV